MSETNDHFLAAAVARPEMDLKVSLLAAGQIETTSYAWYLVDRSHGEERIMLLADEDQNSVLTTITHFEDVRELEKNELTKKFFTLWDMKPID